MKKFIFSTAFLALALCATSCGNDEDTQEPPAPPAAKITLSVAGGESITIDGADVTKRIAITASAKSDKDIEITLKADGAEAGQVAFPVNPILLKAGKTTADAAVTFPLEGFPVGTVEKNIGITITCSAEQVIIGANKTATFAVKGAGIKEPVALAVTTNGSEFNTTNAAQEAKITFTLAEALDADLSVALAYSGDSQLKEITLPEVKISKGATTTTATIAVGKGLAGAMKLTLATTGANLDKQNLTFTFTKDADPVTPPTASISASGSTDVSVDGADVTKTINITLDKAAAQDVVINFTATEGGTLSAAAVTITAGATSGTASITFPASVYTTGVKKDVTVTATSTQATVAPAASSITYKVSGPVSTPEGKQDLGLFFNTDNSNNATTTVDITGDFWVYIRKGDGKTQQGNIEVTYTVEGFESSELWISGSGIIDMPEGSSGWREATGKILVTPNDNGIMNINVGGSPTSKSGKVTFTSDDATFKEGASSAVINFNLNK